MRTARILMVSLLVGMATVSCAEDEKNQQGRYRIVSAPEDAVFMIDTQTGRSWSYVRTGEGGIWVPVIFKGGPAPEPEPKPQ